MSTVIEIPARAPDRMPGPTRAPGQMPALGAGPSKQSDHDRVVSRDDVQRFLPLGHPVNVLGRGCSSPA